MKIISTIALVVAASLAVAPAAEAKGRSSHSSSSSHSKSTSSAGTGSHNVKGYTKKNGTYVAPHRQTNPNSTKADNWSTKGNVNPYTGKPGTKNP